MRPDESFIVYRSRMDAEADAFWWDLFEKNPTAFAWGIGLLSATILLSIVIIVWPKKPKYWRF